MHDYHELPDSWDVLRHNRRISVFPFHFILADSGTQNIGGYGKLIPARGEVA